MSRFLIFILLALLAASSTSVAAPVPRSPVTISEVLYDAVGRDDGRVFVELFGPAGFPLAGWALTGRNGRGGGVTNHILLDGLVIPADGLLVIADADGSGATEIPSADALFADIDLQNGPDSLELYEGGFVRDALAWGVFGAEDLSFGEGLPAPGVAPGESLARLFANVDTDSNFADFIVLSVPTPGAAEFADTVVATPEPTAFVLMGSGLILLGARGIRRERAKRGITRRSSEACPPRCRR